MGWYKAGYKEKIPVTDSKEITEKGNALDARQANKNIEGTLAHDIYKEIAEVKKSASDGKTAVADAITAMNQATQSDAPYSTMAANIQKISSDATAGAGHILTGKTVYAGGKKITGAMPDNGAVAYNLPVNGSYTIPAGCHNGKGRVSQDIGIQGAQTIVPGTSDKYISAGKYLTGIQTVKGDANLIPANIARGKSIFGVNGSARCGALKFSLGQRAELGGIISKTGITQSFTFTGGPDGLKWYNWCVPDGKTGDVVFSISKSALGNHPVTGTLGVIIRTIFYSADAPASSKNGHAYGPDGYSDYWVPGRMYGGYLGGGFVGTYTKKAPWIYYSFDWGDAEKNSLRLTFSNRDKQTSSGDTWTQWGFTLYPVTGIGINSFDAYEGTGFNSRDIMGL